MWRASACGFLLLTVCLAFPCLNAQPVSPPTPPKDRDLSKLTPQERHFYVCAQRGMEWLQRANKPDGRFVAGLVPALRAPMDGDSYLRQAGAAFALARTASFYGDERCAALAKQALLTLLLETSSDPKEVSVRTIPPHLAHPIAASAVLLTAIHELPAPAADLLDQGDQLANGLQRLLRTDGSFTFTEAAGPNGPAPGAFAEASESNKEAAEALRQTILHHTGPALYAIIHSQHLRPAPWKIEALRKARLYYHFYWKQDRNLAMPAWHTGAYVEAYLLTREAGFAEAVFEMNDWLCGLQFQQVDAARAGWVGGFQACVAGKAVPLLPDINSAAAALSLADACRLARATGDVQHYQRYRQALEGALQFLTTLQYSETNTQHFADWYRPTLIGAFHASRQDGNVRLDYAQNALAALIQYLHHVADVRPPSLTSSPPRGKG
jgi:hypothetical protein